MSQASKYVQWCLLKAEKETKEGKKKGQRNPKHRGLLKVNQNKVMAIEYINKSAENLNFALSLDISLHGHIAISSLFYSMCHCFLAIASKFGYESRNQTCTISLMEYLKEEKKIEIDNKFIEMFKYKEDQKEKGEFSLIEMREDYTYGAKTSIDKEIIKELVQDCRKLIEETKLMVHS